MKDFLKTHFWEIPLYLIAAGLPLITFFYVDSPGLEKFAWFPNRNTWIDFFLYGKSKCVHILALVLVFNLLIRSVKKKSVRLGKEWVWVLLLGCLEVVSAFVSSMPQQSFWGEIEQYETIWVLLGYLVIGIGSYQYTMQNEEPIGLRNALMFGAAVSCVIGFSQLFQMDFWESTVGKTILVPEDFSDLREKLRFTFSEDSWKSVYMALYNPNYAGIYLLMLLPSMLFEKNRKLHILAVGTVLCIVGTFSRTVWVAAIIIFVLGTFLFRKVLSEKEKKVIMTVLIGATLLLGVAFLSQTLRAQLSTDERLEAVVCEEEFIKITYQGEKIWFRDVPVENGVKYEICYEDGSHVALKWNENSGRLEPYAEKLQGLTFKVYEKDGISYAVFYYQEIPFRFTRNVETGKYVYISVNGKIDELKVADTAFAGHETFLSGRGYIWSRALPLVLKNPLLGTGPDSFLLVFPQNDYVARANLGHAFFTQLLTNAHSFYIQMAVQTGIPALLCFVIFTLIYIKKSWKIYCGKMHYTEMEKVGAGFFLGVLSYLICGLTFASCVCTTPFFWMLIGCGTAVNCKLNDKGSV